jgi:hypothetical protein
MNFENKDLKKVLHNCKITNGSVKIGTLRTVSRHFLKEFMVLFGKDTFVYFTSFIPLSHDI